MSDQFYRAFEEKFRGPRALIQQRLAVYLPFVQPVCAVYPDALVLDLGCGRGEWLELLQSNAISARGVDLDSGMLEACRQINLQVQSQDALECLKEMKDGSAAVISAFHLVEHLPFDSVKELVVECHRVLKAGGLLIMETPNPENFMVATQSFYLDPTHLRPIPPDLLAFVPEHFGYESVKILRLQEPVDIKTHPNLSMLDVLTGASPDYAVVAQKAGHPELKSSLQGLFDQAFGITGHALLERHRQQTNDARFKLEKLISNAQLSAQKSEILTSQLQSRAYQLSEHIQNLQLMQQRTYKGDVGWLVLQILRLAEQGVGSRLKALCLKVLRLFMSPLLNFTQARPVLKMRLIRLSQFLGLEPFLRKYFANPLQAASGNAKSENSAPISRESMSQNAQRLAQTLQNKKRS